MKRWAIGKNDYYFTGHIYLEEAPWYIFALEHTIQYICSKFPRIPLPKIKIIRDYGEGDKHHETNLQEYYGTTADLFHCFVCSPVFYWCCDRIKSDCIAFPFDNLKEIFPKVFEDENMSKFDDEYIDMNREYSEKIGKEFNVVYNKLKLISEDRMKDIQWPKRKD